MVARFRGDIAGLALVPTDRACLVCQESMLWDSILDVLIASYKALVLFLHGNVIGVMNHQAKPPEKKKRKKMATNLSPPSFSLLPDEIIENCLARVPRSYYPKLSLVSKSFRSILSSMDLYTTRSRLGRTQQCLYICLEGSNSNSISTEDKYLQLISFSMNPNGTNRKHRIGQFSVPVPFSSNATEADPAVVGSEIYVFGGCDAPSSSVRVLDCLSHTWRESPSMNVPRQNPLSCAYDGKIYVIGSISGSLKDECGEVFDIKTQTWEHFPNASGLDSIDGISEFKGKIYFRNKFGKTVHYDPKQCKWQKNATFRWSECVIDNVSYLFQREDGGQYNLWWRNINGGRGFKEVKGLVSLGNRYKRYWGSRGCWTKTFSCGGKVYHMWEGCPKKNNPNGRVNVCCAEISVEKRDEDEIWGNIEWLGVVHAFSHPHNILHSLAISL